MSGTGIYTPPVEETATIEHVQGLIAASQRNQPGYAARVMEVDPTQALEERMSALNLAASQTQVCVWTCRQKTLRSMCSALRHPPPEYQKETFQSRTNETVHRFVVVVPSNRCHKAVAWTGRYSADEFLAREDAATELMKQLAEDADVVVDNFNRDLLELEKWEHYALRNRFERLRARLEEVTDSLHKWKTAACPEYVPGDTSSESN
ncbi:hypothetical protein PIB30_061189 [Stylosanthes scabra]|uniref:Uncharacterized protein n=1 Tax=Stylosanthes scabra TaxID=79078 RepID=A0ABU6TKH9_9FABA|nr:hypothetical protein [Stylosanthes scabra]